MLWQSRCLWDTVGVAGIAISLKHRLFVFGFFCMFCKMCFFDDEMSFESELLIKEKGPSEGSICCLVLGEVYPLEFGMDKINL